MIQINVWVAVTVALLLAAVLSTLLILVKSAIKAEDKTEMVAQLLQVIRTVVVAALTLLGGSAAAIGLTSCNVKRSITLQGTVVQSTSGDSTRIIISSQESYKGQKE